jgi:hypothetical protein
VPKGARFNPTKNKPPSIGPPVRLQVVHPLQHGWLNRIAVETDNTYNTAHLKKSPKWPLLFEKPTAMK